MGKNVAAARNSRPLNIRDKASEVVKETPFEAIASICSVLVVGLFILTFLAQNYVIPSGSMKNTLLVGDHLVVDQITLSPPASWMPLIRYREPRRGDIVVFRKPVYQPGIDATDADGTPQYTPLVKRLIGVPGDHIHLRNGIVIVNGVAQPVGFAQPTTTDNFNEFLDDFPAVPPSEATGSTESWAVNFSNYVHDGDLVVPPGMFRVQETSILICARVTNEVWSIEPLGAHDLSTLPDAHFADRLDLPPAAPNFQRLPECLSIPSHMGRNPVISGIQLWLD